jgi:hypothetical protein
LCLADKEQQEVPACGEQRELLVEELGEMKVAVTQKICLVLMLGQHNDILAFSVTVIICLTDHIMDAIPMCTFYIRSHSHFLPRGGRVNIG